MASPPRHILGISAYYHDSAACLLRDGAIIAAAQEERFSRIKGDASFPEQAVAYCLETAGVAVEELEAVAFYEKPLLRLERLLETYLAIAPRGLRQFLKAGPLWMKEKLFTDRELRKALAALPRNLGVMNGRMYEGPVRYAEHHESHAASAFYPSPFEESAVLTIDGVGEWSTASIVLGRGSDLELLQELHWPHSLGLLYSAFTQYAGFRVNSGEYKVMGLAPYGQPRYVETILHNLVDLREDGSFTLDQRYFDYVGGLSMTSSAFHDLFGGPPRSPESELTQREMDLARSVQEVCDEIVLRMARTAHRVCGVDALCLAGGVALNCVSNARLLREGPFRRIWIQPAAGDAGGALGVAQLVWHREMGEPRRHLQRRQRTHRASSAIEPIPMAPIAPTTGAVPDGERYQANGVTSDSFARDRHGRSRIAVADARPGSRSIRVVDATGDSEARYAGGASLVAGDAMHGAYLGPEFLPAEIGAFLHQRGIPAVRLERDALLRAAAERLANGHVIGWFQGRMEFGPRALGSRSILGDPRRPHMQSLMNLKIKFRESFRPFAPSVLHDRAAEYFELDVESPYMLLVASVRAHRRTAVPVDEQRARGVERLRVARSDIPAVTHVDYSARVQTVHRDTNPIYHDLLVEFERQTGCAVLINTSFNVRGEPIVCTPEDAYRCFMRTDLDHLVLWPYLLEKTGQPTWIEPEQKRLTHPLD